jgi:tetratricopeptide (TPR) repeat protein
VRVGRHGRWAAITVGLVACVAGRARGQDDDPAAARAHHERGMAFYAERAFDDAARELEAAYALDPRRELLFTQAQATRLAGRCAEAVVLYRRFLATEPPPQQAEATRIAMARCPVPPAVLAAAPASIVRAAPVTVAARPPPPRGAPFYRDWKGGALIAGGLLAAGVGGALMVSGAASDRSAQREEVLGDFSRLHEQAVRRWRVGLGAALAGAVLGAAGAGRYLWVSAAGAGVGGRF